MLSLDRSRSHRYPGQPPCHLLPSPQKLTLSSGGLQSSFDDPCSALDQGFTTGFVPVSPGALPTRKEFVVDKPGPLWFYCQQQQPHPHCQAGMVFGGESRGFLSSSRSRRPDLTSFALTTVNTQDKFEEFKANAAKQPVNVRVSPLLLARGSLAG